MWITSLVFYCWILPHAVIPSVCAPPSNSSALKPATSLCSRTWKPHCYWCLRIFDFWPIHISGLFSLSVLVLHLLHTHGTYSQLIYRGLSYSLADAMLPNHDPFKSFHIYTLCSLTTLMDFYIWAYPEDNQPDHNRILHMRPCFCLVWRYWHSLFPAASVPLPACPSQPQLPGFLLGHSPIMYD